MTKANGLLDAFGTYQVTVFDVTSGCMGTSNTVTVSDFAGQRNRLLISPNPTQGIVRLSYYSSTTIAQGSLVSLYDSKWAKIMTKTFLVAGNYGSAELNLTSLNKGTYLAVLKDAAGNKIATERILKY